MYAWHRMVQYGPQKVHMSKTQMYYRDNFGKIHKEAISNSDL